MRIWKHPCLRAAAAFACPAASIRRRRRPIRTGAITLVIPFAPGGSTSIVGRVIADKMSQMLGQKIMVDNRPGAGGTVGTKAVAKSDPDGYTLLLGYTGTLAIGPSLYKKVGYDPRKDFAPIGMIGNAPSSLVVHPSFPGQNRRRTDRLCQGQSRQGQFRLRRRRLGQPHHRRIFRPLGRHHAGAYSLQGHRPALTDLLGGHIPMAFAPIPAAHANVEAGIVARAGGDQQDPHQPDAGRADDRRDRPARIRCLAVLRPGRAGRHAAADHRQAQ